MRVQEQAILFADQVGSTKLLAEIGDEAMVAVHNRMWSIFTTAVTNHNGEVLSDEGDGGSAVFDQADAAAMAALQMLDACKDPGQDDPTLIDLRVAIHTGPVIRTEGAAVGLAVHLAARLCDEAPAGYTVASNEAASELAGHPDLRLTPFGQRSMKGIDHPVAVNVMTRTSEAAPAPEALQRTTPIRFRSSPLLNEATDTTSFVGRRPELALLEQSLAWSSAATPEIVLVEGAPGTGKSTLTQHFAKAAVQDGAVCLIGRSDEALDDPFHEIIEMLQHAVADAPLSLLADHVVRNGSLLTRLLPSLGDRVPAASLTDQDPAPDQRRLFDAVADFIRSMAREQQVVLILEDIHWASSSSLDLFRFLLRDAVLGSVLLIATYRGEELEEGSASARFVSMISDEPHASLASLSAFDVAAVTTLCRDVVDVDDDVLTELALALHRDTGGNPLFCAEMLRSLRSDRRLNTLAASEVHSVLDVPRSIQDVALRRVQRLGTDVVAVLTDAAVLGETFEFRALRLLAETSPLKALDTAERVELISADDAAGERYTFGHALVQRALYDSMSTASRVDRHRAAADALTKASKGVRTSNASEILRHLQNAGVLAEQAEVVEAAQLAAEAAEGKLALDEAIRLRQLVVDTLGIEAPDPRELACALLELGRVQTAALRSESRTSMANAARAAEAVEDWDLHATIATEYGGALKENQAPIDVAEPVGLIDKSLQHHTEPGPIRSGLLMSLALWQRQHRPYAERRPLVDQAMAPARAMQDRRQLAALLADQHRALHGPNVADEALTIAAELNALGTELDDDVVRFQALYVKLVASLAVGSWTDAKETGEQIEDVGHRLRNIEGRRVGLMWQTVQAQITGDTVASRALITELTELLESYPSDELSRFLAVFIMPSVWFSGRLDLMYQARDEQDPQHGWMAWFAAESGRLEEAEEHLRLATRPAEIEQKSDYLWWLEAVAITRTARALDLPTLAAEMYHVMLPYRAHNSVLGLGCFLGTAEHHLGTLSAVQGDLHLAIDHFDRALKRYELMSATPFIALTSAELSNALRRRNQGGDRARADTLRELAEDFAASHRLGLVTQTLDGLPEPQD